MKIFLSFIFLFSAVIMAYGQNTDSQRYLEEGNSCFEKGDYDCAKKNYEASRATGGNVTEQIQKTEECIKILFAANLLFEGGNFSKACEQYEQILKINPNDPLVKVRVESCKANGDIIILKSGQNIKALVLEIDSIDVIYKKLEEPNGINYVLKKSEISIIMYANGSRDEFAKETINKPDSPITGEKITGKASELTSNEVKRRNGDVFNSDGIELVFVEGKGGVTDFYIGKFEVTQAQWIAIMGRNPSGYKGDFLPVTNVSWNDIQVFISNLNRKTGSKYRLPTEVEWEYAARGGNISENYKFSGSNNSTEVAWTYYDRNGSRPSIVGTKAPNELGIYDMSGNVWEWCANQFRKKRVFRGGATNRSEQYCLPSTRTLSTNAKYSHSLVGFRISLTPQQSSTTNTEASNNQNNKGVVPVNNVSAISKSPENVVPERITGNSGIGRNGEIYNPDGILNSAVKSKPVNTVAEMKVNYPSLYSQYSSGRKMVPGGLIMMLTGIASLSVGIATLEDDPLQIGDDFGIPFVVLGAALTVTGFSIMLSGGIKQTRAVNEFNRQYYSSHSSSPSFQINVYPKRVGLAYVF